MILTPCPYDPINGEQVRVEPRPGLPSSSWASQPQINPKSLHPLDLSRAPYVLYGVKYIDLVSLGAEPWPVNLTLTWVVRPMFCMVLNI